MAMHFCVQSPCPVCARGYPVHSTWTWPSTTYTSTAGLEFSHGYVGKHRK